MRESVWVNSMKAALQGSPFFVRDVWRGVYRAEKNKIRPKEIKKALSGAVLGRGHVSPHVVETLARAEANRALLNVKNTLLIGDLNLSADDTVIKNWCKLTADWCAIRWRKSPMPSWELREIAKDYGVPYPINSIFGHEGAAARMVNEKWWRRQVRVLKMRKIDELARAHRLINAKASVYCSDELLRLRRAQRSRNRAILEGTVATNSEGQQYTLAELSDLSPSNPVIRRHELMVRMSGFEEVAKEFGHVGVFFTMTAPSVYHPTRQVKSGGKLVRVLPNPSWNDATVKDAHAWMAGMWQKVRAKWNRGGIRAYGFRVVEPHADGCPHWHALLFFEDEMQAKKAKAVLKAYFLSEYGDERGAQKYRVKIVDIDHRRGSATGYIAKYIAKNIDGTHIGDDLFGNDAVQAAERINAWAGGHGIRQFQQIGGPSVQVWRELRRMDDGEGYVELARQAADSSDWAAYCLVMGGVFVERDAQPIRIARWIETKTDFDTGEVIDLDKSVNQFGEESPGNIFGVISCGKYFLSRVYRWSVDRVNKVVKAVTSESPLLRLPRDFNNPVGSLFGLPVTPMDDDLLLDLMRGDGS